MGEAIFPCIIYLLMFCIFARTELADMQNGMSHTRIVYKCGAATTTQTAAAAAAATSFSSFLLDAHTNRKLESTERRGQRFVEHYERALTYSLPNCTVP